MSGRDLSNNLNVPKSSHRTLNHIYRHNLRCSKALPNRCRSNIDHHAVCVARAVRTPCVALLRFSTLVRIKLLLGEPLVEVLICVGPHGLVAEALVATFDLHRLRVVHTQHPAWQCDIQPDAELCTG